ncbi:hypothetical protein ACS0TY_031777 [Phlomoides rotata]
MVSLGPYHHGKPELSWAERFKYICLDSCSGGDELRKAELYKLILKNIAEIKRCYADQDETFARFADDRAVSLMMLLDACFILNFMLNSFIFPDPNDNTEQINIDIPDVNNIRDWVDFLGLASSIQYASRDIILLENQVPFLVITLMMNLLYDAETRRLLLVRFFRWIIGVERESRQIIIPGVKLEAPIHLLEACWRVLVMKEDNIAPIQSPLIPLAYSPPAFYTNHSVTSLKAKGIIFRKSDSQCLRDIKFNPGYIRARLHIPIRYFSPQCTVNLSNLVAYEVSPSTRTEHVVLCYVNLMKSLIPTPEDVKELQRQGILSNNFANDEQALQALKEINTFGLSKFNTFGDVRQRIDAHCRKMRKVLMVNLYYMHFKTPWSAMGFFAGFLLLFLASVQTYFTVFPRKFEDVFEGVLQDFIDSKILLKNSECFSRLCSFEDSFEEQFEDVLEGVFQVLEDSLEAHLQICKILKNTWPSGTKLDLNSYLPVRHRKLLSHGDEDKTIKYSKPPPTKPVLPHRKLLSSDRSNKTPVLSPAVATEHRPRRGSEQIAIHKKEHPLPHTFRAGPGAAHTSPNILVRLPWKSSYIAKQFIHYLDKVHQIPV